MKNKILHNNELPHSTKDVIEPTYSDFENLFSSLSEKEVLLLSRFYHSLKVNDMSASQAIASEVLKIINLRKFLNITCSAKYQYEHLS